MIGNPDRMLIHSDMLAVLRAAFCQGTTGSVPNVAQSWVPDVKRLITLHLGEDSQQHMALAHLGEMSVR